MKHSHSIWRALSGFILASAPLLAWSQAATEPVGYVKTVTGEAFVVTASQSVKAQPGTAVLFGSSLNTSKPSSMALTFTDHTLTPLGHATG